MTTADGTGTAGVSTTLAAFVATLQAEDVPSDVRDRMRLLILDSMGVAIGATALDEAAPVIDYIEELGGRPEATALGARVRVPARSAAFVNAWLGDLLDYEDTQKFGGNHPGATMVPTALAIGERVGANGADLMAALVAGYEVANRVARGVFPFSTLRGFLPTGASGTIGSAATAARLLGLSAERTANALNIAGFILPLAAADTLWEGESAKPAHAAHAAATGVDAAALAARGFTAAPLEGGRRKLGYLHMVTDAPDVAAITSGLGRDYTLMDLAIKQYPACGYTNGAIDAALALHERLGDAVHRIESIRVSSYRLVVIAVDRHTDPASTFTACQFSLPYTVAAALIDGAFGVEQLAPARRADPAVHALADKVQLVEDPEMTASFPASMRYRIDVTVDGSVVSHSVDAPLGTARNPMDEGQIRAKYRRVTGSILAGDLGGLLEREIDGLEAMPHLRWPELAPRPVR
jgi:2-methylcitrate dehydratase PrpD